MATLAELAQGPNVTGAIRSGLQGRSELFQLQDQERQKRSQDALDQAFAGGIPTGDARQTAQSEAFRTGGAQAGLGLRDIFAGFDEERRQSEAREGQAIARGLTGVRDQATYNQALAGLNADPNVDVSSLPPEFDSNRVQTIINGARELEDIVGGIRSPQEFEQDLALRTAGASTTNVNVDTAGNKLPNPPPGTAYAIDPATQRVATQDFTLPNGSVVQQPITVPIAGGPVEAETAAVEAAAAGKEQTEQRVANVVTTNINNVRSLIETATLPTVGFAGNLLSNIGGTAARDISASLDTIRANVGFGALQEMRNNSPTGGALGQVSERELALLTSTLANLEQSQSKPQLLRNLTEIEQQFNVLTAGTPEQRDQLLAGAVSSMTIEQLQSIDPSTLSDEDLAAAARRFNELNNAR